MGHSRWFPVRSLAGVEARNGGGWKEGQHGADKNGTELFYLSVGQQPAWLRLRSLASYRWTRGREREARRSRRRPGQVSRFFGSPPPSNGSGNDGRMHPSVVHRCNSNNGTRARALLTRRPFFPRPLSLCRVARSLARTRSAAPRPRSFSLSLRCVARASGPISSWTSHHSITLSMPVRPCLPRARCPCALDTRVVVPLIIVHQFLSTACLAIEFGSRSSRDMHSRSKNRAPLCLRCPNIFQREYSNVLVFSCKCFKEPCEIASR